MATLALKQGASETIRFENIKDAAGVALDLTGWTVHAQARPDAKSSVLFAEWHTTPTGSQQTATAGAGLVVLDCPHTASTSWTGWAGTVAVVGVEATSPGGQRASFTASVYLEPEIVRVTV